MVKIQKCQLNYPANCSKWVVIKNLVQVSQVVLLYMERKGLRSTMPSQSTEEVTSYIVMMCLKHNVNSCSSISVEDIYKNDEQLSSILIQTIKPFTDEHCPTI